MMIPSHELLEELSRARGARLRSRPISRTVTPSSIGLRVRLGRVLIAAGRSIGGDRADLPARPGSSPNPA